MTTATSLSSLMTSYLPGLTGGNVFSMSADHSRPQTSAASTTKFNRSSNPQQPQRPHTFNTRLFVEESAKAILAPIAVVPALYLSSMLLSRAEILPPEESFSETPSQFAWGAQWAGFGIALAATWIGMEAFLTALTPVLIVQAAHQASRNPRH